MRSKDSKHKSSMVGLFLCRRHQSGLRSKAATAVTAGIRMKFALALEPTDFLDAAIISTARAACQLDPTEMRKRRNAGPTPSVKLPVSEDILDDIRAKLWDGKELKGKGLESRMIYVGCVWAYDTSSRVSEYTVPEPGSEDHGIQVDDLSFYIETPAGSLAVTGSALALRFQGVLEGCPSMLTVTECHALAVSTKNKAVIKPKVIARRSPQESRFLDDLILVLSRAGSRGSDGLFTVRRPSGVRVTLTGRKIRVQVKDACKKRGLPFQHFSSHSLRKGGITQMRYLGASEDDRRDRGGYAANSQVMNCTYDYATGLGPLAANSLPAGRRTTVASLQRLIPAVREP